MFALVHVSKLYFKASDDVFLLLFMLSRPLLISGYKVVNSCQDYDWTIQQLQAPENRAAVM